MDEIRYKRKSEWGRKTPHFSGEKVYYVYSTKSTSAPETFCEKRDFLADNKENRITSVLRNRRQLGSAAGLLLTRIEDEVCEQDDDAADPHVGWRVAVSIGGREEQEGGGQFRALRRPCSLLPSMLSKAGIHFSRSFLLFFSFPFFFFLQRDLFSTWFENELETARALRAEGAGKGEEGQPGGSMGKSLSLSRRFGFLAMQQQEEAENTVRKRRRKPSAFQQGLRTVSLHSGCDDIHASKFKQQRSGGLASLSCSRKRLYILAVVVAVVVVAKSHLLPCWACKHEG